MGATFYLAALLMMGQTSSGSSLNEKTAQLSDDIKQTMTLFDTLKLKVANEKDGATLIKQLNQKLQLIAQTAAKYQSETKSEDAKATLAVIRFEALANCVETSSKIETLASEIATKYRDNSALCPSIENLTFLRYLTQEKYPAFDTILKQSKNDEVIASANLANYFAQTMNDTLDINKFKNLSQSYPKTKAGQRAARIYDYRTKMSLGAPMPELELELLNGYKLKVGSLKGRVVVIDFYGFWSPSCIAEMPEIKDYVTKNPTKIAWIGVNTDVCTKSYLTQRLKEGGANWQNTYAGSVSGQLPMDLGIIAYPSKIIIDSYGIIKYVPNIRDWRSILEEALSKA